jgi:hypothetical protein
VISDYDKAKKMKPSEAAALARRLRPELLTEGRRRQAAAGRREGIGRGHNSRAIIAHRCGYSRRTLAMALFVLEAAETDPDKYGAARRFMDESRNVTAAYNMVAHGDTVRVMRQHEIFITTTVCGVSLGDLSASQLRHLVAFISVLAKNKALATSTALSAAEIFSVDEVRRALAQGDRARRAVRFGANAFARKLPKAKHTRRGEDG